MNRRQFIRRAGSGLVGAGVATGVPLVHAMDYSGKLLIVVQAFGGWDPTSFCDPKANTAGERVINRWALSEEIQTAGNINYAPWASNAAFFQKYHRNMLVINGVDAQTNSHDTGVLYNYSGRNSAGLPTLTALFAANFAPDTTMPYLNFGGFGATEGVIRSTRLDAPQYVRLLAAPNIPEWATVDDYERYFVDQDWTRLVDSQISATTALASRARLLPKSARNRTYYESALQRTGGLAGFADILPPDDELQREEPVPTGVSTLKRQGQIALLAFKSGVAVSADLGAGEFDTHTRHEEIHEPSLASFTESVDWIWDYAESLDLADRLVMVLASDFGRTNFYNADNGKDHWPIGSVIVMEKNQPWTNRAVGETDDLHFAQRINPATLVRDDSGGTLIHPSHIHDALRAYLGLANAPITQPFALANTEAFDFFST